MKEAIKKYLNLRVKMDEMKTEMQNTQDEIIEKMNKKKISTAIVDKHEISLISYQKYRNWNNKKLHEHLGDDYDLYVTKETKLKVDTKQLKESSEWETVKRFATETNVTCLKVKEV